MGYRGSACRIWNKDYFYLTPWWSHTWTQETPHHKEESNFHWRKLIISSQLLTWRSFIYKFFL